MYRSCLIALLFCWAALPLRAVTLDWATQTWPMPPTVTSNQSVSFDIDPTNPGNDITINLTLQNNARWQGNRPDVVASLAFGGDNALHVVYETFDGTLAYLPSVDISIEFHYVGGVYLEDLQLGDVEAMSGGRREETVRNFVGTPVTGPNVNATITKPASSTNVAIFDSGLPTANAVGTGFASDSNPMTAGTANVFVSFDAPLTQADFNWGRADMRGDLNGNQGLFIGNITYTPAIPEAEVYWGGALLLAAAGWHFWRQRKARLKLATAESESS